ncbi:SDR family NAD(P)-dependent oxidoreductase [Gracilibacillus salitolerans]|uniref:SDR family NAD(P)-dependent oxidoreductase n=1 Tax=Gracilibacillus salitolerans TaxID=2663022 RepID=A0A5Q2TPW3_9BACI|nr:SDR family oxidoreductase [Gracilibacillus salitolerans]QGH35028.1 SDR family NAD(P)-dependent oxidoreductase [Gracilibacillus salitolerans]
MAVFAKDALKERHILITGATGGIGYETAKVIVSMGAKVTITGRNQDKLNLLEKELMQDTTPDQICVATADITKEADRSDLIKTAEEKLGFISDLVNSAGVSGGAPVEQLETDVIEQIMDINYFSTFRLTKTIYQKMIPEKRGNIVNVASLSGLRGTYGNSAYASSKFAMIGWTQSMALEAIEHNIRVNAVCPGFVDTDMAHNILKKKAERNDISYEQTLENAKNSIPSGRLISALEVANTIAFVLTDAAQNIVGESVKISGGSVMR